MRRPGVAGLTLLTVASLAVSGCGSGAKSTTASCFAKRAAGQALSPPVGPAVRAG